MNLLEIFKTGTFTDMSGQVLSFSAADLQATADAYDPALFRSPLVVGHPKLDDPAYGWVSKLSVVNDTLQAAGDQVEPKFAEMVNTGRFPKMSASFYTPNSPSNPKPGVWYLKHVGFLGAQAPAVLGLKPASFAAADEQIITVEFAAAGADTTIESEKTNVTTKEKESAEFAEQKAQLDAQQANIEARELALKNKEQAARTTEIAAFAESLVKEGKLLPREQAGMVAFMAGLDDAGTVSFASPDGDVKKPSGEWLREFMSGLPQRVDFAEHSRAEQEETTTDASFAAPSGYAVDADRLKLHNKIVAHQKKHNVDYATAASAVGG